MFALVLYGQNIQFLIGKWKNDKKVVKHSIPGKIHQINEPLHVYPYVLEEIKEWKDYLKVHCMS